MPKEKKKCRVCGKLYTACRTASPVPGAYNWREVACSPECSVEYIRRVAQAREKGASHTEALAEAVEEASEQTAEQAEDLDDFCGADAQQSAGCAQDCPDAEEYGQWV